MKKYIVTLLLMMILSIPVFSIAEEVSYFSDVDPSSPYAAAINWAVDQNITSGTSKDRFTPNGGCTRAQIVTFLWRCAGRPESDAAGSFSDVDIDDYYYEAVNWAVSKGVTNGTGDGKFSPDIVCSRAQAVTFLWRSENCPEPLNTYALIDVTDNQYFYSPVCWAMNQGVTQGVNKYSFAPDDPCTRAQIVTFLYRNVGYSLDPIPATNQEDLKKAAYSSYREVLSRLESQYGSTEVLNMRDMISEDYYYMAGIAYLNLIDFDQDGLEELVVCVCRKDEVYPDYKVGIYAFNGEASDRIFTGSTMIYDGSQPILISKKENDNRYYYHCGGADVEQLDEYWTKERDSFIKIQSLYYDLFINENDDYEGLYQINGENVSEQRYVSEQSLWTDVIDQNVNYLVEFNDPSTDWIMQTYSSCLYTINNTKWLLEY